MKVLNAVWFFFILITVFFSVNTNGREYQGSSLRGKDEMPSPAFLPLDYQVSRAKAWLNALENASQLLSVQAENRLWDLDCDTEAGRMGLASLLFPIFTATPDITTSNGIEVFLQETPDLSDRTAEIFDTPELFLTQLSLLLDMERILTKIREIRADNTNDTEKMAARLTPLGEGLEQIWNSSRLLQKQGGLSEAAKSIEDEKGLYIQALIRACEKKLDEQKNHAAQMLADKALLKLEQPEYEKDPAVLKKYLSGVILRLRSIALWKQNQLALAAKDLEKACSFLDETGLSLELRGQAYLELGTLKKIRRDQQGMCAAFRKACALGQCAPLAEYRRQGVCLEQGRL